MSRARVTLAEAIAPQTSDGLWQLNAGMPMENVCIYGSDMPMPVTLVIDLSTLKARADRIVALRDHEERQVVGYWDSITIAPAAPMRARLSLIPAADPAVDPTESQEGAADLRAIISAGVPLQCSVGASPDPERDGAFVPLAAAETVNGQLIDPAKYEQPVYVLRNGIVDEASLVVFGADSHTGRLAASANHHQLHKGNPMDFKQRRDALVAKLGSNHLNRIAVLLTEGATDQQIVDEAAKTDAEQQAAEMTALRDQVSSLTAKLAEANAKLEAAAKLGGNAPNGTAPVPPASTAALAHTPAERAALMREGVVHNGVKLTGFAALHHIQKMAEKAKKA